MLSVTIKTPKSTRATHRLVTLFAALLVMLAACASGGKQTLVLNTSHVPAVGYLPDEMIALLEDLGYEMLPESAKQRLAQSFDSFKLQFKAAGAGNIRLDVDFRLTEKLTDMHVYNTDQTAAGAAIRPYYNQLKARLQEEFGADSVR